MQVELTIKDLILLASSSKLEKDGVAITINRPILTEIKADPRGSKTEVRFFLDDSDKRSKEQK